MARDCGPVRGLLKDVLYKIARPLSLAGSPGSVLALLTHPVSLGTSTAHSQGSQLLSWDTTGRLHRDDSEPLELRCQFLWWGGIGWSEF